jgi:hypothetical protein
MSIVTVAQATNSDDSGRNRPPPWDAMASSAVHAIRRRYCSTNEILPITGFASANGVFAGTIVTVCSAFN